MNKILMVMAPFALCASLSAQADIIGGSVEVAYWYAGTSGTSTFNNTRLDLEDDLNLDNDSFFDVAATLEHPVPVLPNVRLKYVNMEQIEDGKIPGNSDSDKFDDVATGKVETTLDLSHIDLILYYEILDNWVSVDVGLDVKKFDGKLRIFNDKTDDESNIDIDEVLPLGYLSAEVALPLTDLSFGVEVSGISYSDNAISDAKVRIRQGFSLAFIELGYRQMAIKVDDIDDLDVDIDLSGVYLSTGIDF